MAFEAYRNQARPGATRVRRVMFLVAALLHGGIISGGVAYSYWHVDELTAPTLRVTFISAAPPPPPPPPPPPAGGGGVKKKVALKPKAVEIPIATPKPTEIVQPRERPAPVKKEFRKHTEDEEEEDEPAGVKGGVKGGVSGGTMGGTIGGTVGGTPGGTIGGVIGGTAPPTLVAPKFLPPQMGALQKESGADPAFPPSLNHGGVEYLIQTKICVARTGTVESVTLMKRADALLDESVLTAVKKWRFRPLMANGNAVPFCYFGRFEFKSHL